MMTERPSRQVQFVSAEVEDLGNDRSRVHVKLRKASGELYIGTVEGPSSSADTLQAAAQAAVEAALQAAGSPKTELAVEKVQVNDSLGPKTVFVAITDQYDRRVRPLLGLCVVHADVIQAVAFAVLNATNRILGIG
jgi:hypothetical protein